MIESKTSANMEVRVRVMPSAKKDRLEVTKEGMMIIHTKAKAERNAANDRATAILAEHLRLPDTSVRLIAGHRGRIKRFRILSV